MKVIITITVFGPALYRKFIDVIPSYNIQFCEELKLNRTIHVRGEQQIKVKVELGAFNPSLYSHSLCCPSGACKYNVCGVPLPKPMHGSPNVKVMLCPRGSCLTQEHL